MRYTVRLNNIPETDQLVFKLIFSLSEKASGRTCSYKVNDSDSAAGRDVVIAGSGVNGMQSQPAGADAVLFDVDGRLATTQRYVIRRPLIATRVLRILDDYVASKRDGDEQQAGEQAAALEEPAIRANESFTEVDFCITEEEASELAIVEDESLSNPSNSLLTIMDEEDVEPRLPPVSAPIKHTASLVRLHPDKPDKKEHQLDTQTGAESKTPRPRALVVDDSPSVRKQIELELELFNVDVDYAENMQQAMQLAAEHNYDVAFLDVVLPDGDGFQICRKIKHDIAGITVVMLTGKASPADKIKGTMVGCDAYLVKPVGRMTFQSTVCKYLQLRKQLDAVHA